MQTIWTMRTMRTIPKVLLSGLAWAWTQALLAQVACVPYAPDMGLFINTVAFVPVPSTLKQVNPHAIQLVTDAAGQRSVVVTSSGNIPAPASIPIPAGMQVNYLFFGANNRFLLLDINSISMPGATSRDFKQVVFDLSATSKTSQGVTLAQMSTSLNTRLFIHIGQTNGLAFFVYYSDAGQIQNARVYRSDTGEAFCTAPSFAQQVDTKAILSATGVDIVDGQQVRQHCALPSASLQAKGPSTPFAAITANATESRSYTLTNAGTDCVSVTAIAASAHFKAAFTPLTNLAAGASATVAVAFNPGGDIGTFNEQLPVTSNPPQTGVQLAASAVSIPTTATLTVNHTLRPAADTGRFNLSIDGAVKASGVGNAGSTGAQTVTPGTHQVAATAVGGGTYQSSFSGACDAAGKVTIAAGDAKVCTVTDSGQPRLTFSSSLSPASDTHRFDLLVDGVVRTRAAGDGGTTGPIVLVAGPHSVAETGALDLFNATFAGDCVATGPGTANVTLAAGDDKTCRVANVAKSNVARNVVCSLFDDGHSSVVGPSAAIFFDLAGRACMPDGTGTGTCRKWFGDCKVETSGASVGVFIFDDGYSNLVGPSSAIYVGSDGKACVPDGTSKGKCRKWFGRMATAAAESAACNVFDDGNTSATGFSDAVYSGIVAMPIPLRKACVPDATATGLCRKWWGNCRIPATR